MMLWRKHLEYSDDEQERRAKAKAKSRNRKKGDGDTARTTQMKKWVVGVVGGVADQDEEVVEEVVSFSRQTSRVDVGHLQTGPPRGSELKDGRLTSTGTSLAILGLHCQALHRQDHSSVRTPAGLNHGCQEDPDL
nr:hypothetical protein BaRGS_013913 [Batillaria attramentaria]